MSARIACVLATGTTLLLVASVAPAASLPEPAFGSRSTSVWVADLNLKSDADVGRLYRRLQKAASEVCANSTAPIPTVDDDCRVKALGDAVASIHSPALSELHARNVPPQHRTSRSG